MTITNEKAANAINGFKNAPVGTFFPYYVGNLAAARKSPDKKERQAANMIGEFFWLQYEQGRALLAQKREGDNVCIYLAKKIAVFAAE